MAAIGDILEPTPAIGNLLVLGKRVGDQAEGSQLASEGRGECVRGLAPCFGILILKFVENRLERQFLAVERKPQRGHRLIEQPVPGA